MHFAPATTILPKHYPAPLGFDAPWCNTTRPITQRVGSLVQNLTLEEKTRFFTFTFYENPRIHWHRYNWWNEALHGVAREVLNPASRP